MARTIAALAALAGLAYADSLKDIDHVILFMQENRAFDHYFGTMAGVRGFNDPNVQMNGNKPVWNQAVDSSLTTSASYLNPWYLNYLGGSWPDATQCMVAGSNGYTENHAAYNLGTNDHWALNNTPWSVGYYKKADLPTQFALAENFVVADMYQEFVITSTNPNRVGWISGSINAPGGPQTPDQGGNPYIDNNETPGCETGNINCFPLKWKTAGEYYQDAGVSWSVFQNSDNFDDNPYAWFDQFRTAKSGSALSNSGMKGQSLDAFYKNLAAGTLPEVSYIVGPMQLSEHPPYSPHDGAWLQSNVTQAVLNSPKYNKTALIISYDETGGWFDHVSPYHSPNGTAGEWIQDPYGEFGYTFIGPGFRLPFYIISPWTRNGGVFTEHADHASQIMFVEQWQAAKGKTVTSKDVLPWRRAHMSNLLNAFDFAHPDYSIPSLPSAPKPHVNSNGAYDGSSYCQSQHSTQRPPVPYTGNGAVSNISTVVEQGYKAMRGMLTEGRYLTLELSGVALNNPGKTASATTASSSHTSLSQRWIAHAVVVGGTQFTLQSASNGQYLCANLAICSTKGSAATFEIAFSAGKGYSWKQVSGGKYLSLNSSKKLQLGSSAAYWSMYSVTYT